VKNGHHHGFQWRKCRNCNRQYRSEDGVGLHGQRYPPEIIAGALELFYGGPITYRQTATTLDKRLSIDIPTISAKTVYQWVKVYTEVAFRTMTALRAETGGHWVIEQVWNPAVGCGGWTVSEGDTGYVLATLFCRDSGYEYVTPLLRNAVEACGTHDVDACTFRTNRLMASGKSYTRKVTTSIIRHLPEAQEVAVERIDIQSSPETGVRTFGQFEPWVWDRFRRLRSLESAQRFLDGLTVVHNVFEKPGVTENPAPCRSVGVAPPFASWLDVVRIGPSGPHQHDPKSKAKENH
jgi:transposase-like protein